MQQGLAGAIASCIASDASGHGCPYIIALCLILETCAVPPLPMCSNSKGARKKLVRALVDVPRGNLQLLPYYARVAATISQAYPEVGAGVQQHEGISFCCCSWEANNHVASASDGALSAAFVCMM